MRTRSCDHVIVLEDGTRLTWDLYKDYKFDIIK